MMNIEGLNRMFKKAFNDREPTGATRARGKKVAEGINCIHVEPNADKITSGDCVKYTTLGYLKMKD
jgi:hypothetical protein